MVEPGLNVKLGQLTFRRFLCRSPIIYCMLRGYFILASKELVPTKKKEWSSTLSTRGLIRFLLILLIVFYIIVMREMLISSISTLSSLFFFFYRRPTINNWVVRLRDFEIKRSIFDRIAIVSHSVSSWLTLILADDVVEMDRKLDHETNGRVAANGMAKRIRNAWKGSSPAARSLSGLLPIWGTIWSSHYPAERLWPSLLPSVVEYEQEPLRGGQIRHRVFLFLVRIRLRTYHHQTPETPGLLEQSGTLGAILGWRAPSHIGLRAMQSMPRVLSHSFVRSLAPLISDLMGNRFLFMIQTRRFHTVST